MSNNEWKKPRKVATRDFSGTPIYIFTEGEKTEPNYFNGFKQKIEYNPINKHTVFVEIFPCHQGTKKLMAYARNYIRTQGIKKGIMWLVYDKDDFPASDFDQVVELAKENSNENIIFNVGWSNQSFELWFVLHFNNLQTDVPRQEYITILNKKFRELKIGPYKKNRDDYFEVLIEQGNPKQAIKIAKKKIEDNKDKKPSEIAPGTTVYKLVEKLATYLPDELKEKFI